MLELFAHPFSSYCWKVLIALHENATPFTYRMLDADHPENGERLATISPTGKFPALVDGGHALFEASILIEYLDHACPGTVRFIPQDPAAALETRMMDRVFDNYVMTPMSAVVLDALRPEVDRSPAAVADALAGLGRVYGWLETWMTRREWAAGSFGLADCAAAPALFYADWVHPIPAEFVHLRTYRARLLARPSVQKVVDAARPYRPFFPLGAPDRD